MAWKTTLFTEPYKAAPDPARETDVQWNIACIREVRGNEVVVTDDRRRLFRVDKTTGEVISTETNARWPR